jgi:adenylate cyclase
MMGLVIEGSSLGRTREASQRASEHMSLVESIGDATLTIALSPMAIAVKLQNAEIDDALRWSQTVVDLAQGDPTKGNLVIGSPLAAALVYVRVIASEITGRQFKFGPEPDHKTTIG